MARFFVSTPRFATAREEWAQVFAKELIALQPELLLASRRQWLWHSSGSRAIDEFARTPNGGLVLPPNSTTSLLRDVLSARATAHRLPTV